MKEKRTHNGSYVHERYIAWKSRRNVGNGDEGRVKVVVFHDHITRQTVQLHPKDVWLFGDNVYNSGMGGMAKEMRGEPNCVGIPTKIWPRMDEGAFWHDCDYDWAVKIIDAKLAVAVNLAKSLGGDIIIPHGIGTGLAKLPEKSPKIWDYLQKKLQELETL